MGKEREDMRLLGRRTYMKKRLEVQYTGRMGTLAYLQEFFSEWEIQVLDMRFSAQQRAEGMLYTNTYKIRIPRDVRMEGLVSALEANENIVSAHLKEA